jgi:tripartite-type tricarboxylate transporter receptor subunit TctC
MSNRLKTWGAVSLATAAIMAATPAATAYAAADFSGKTITFIVPFKPGGGSGIYTRFLAPLFTKHLPGKPNHIIKNIPGGGSVKGANVFSYKAKDDGLLVFTTGSGTFLKPILKDKSVKYDPLEFTPLIASPFGLLVYVRKDLGVGPGDVDKLQGKNLIMGDRTPTGGGMPVMLSMRLLNLKVKHIFGLSSGKKRQALQRGETNINQDNQSSYAKKVLPMIEEGIAVPLYTLGFQGAGGKIVRDPMLPDIPTFDEMYEKVHGKKLSGIEAQAWKATFSIRVMAAKMMVLPKKTKKDVLAAYHAAAKKVVKDPVFLGKQGQKLFGPYPQSLGDDALKILTASAHMDPKASKWLRDWVKTVKK